LAKERSQNFDLSYKLQSSAWIVRASVYRNTIKNFIYGASVAANGDGVADRVNVEGDIAPDAELLKREFKNVNARLTGAELSVAYAPTQGFGFSSMADTVRGTITAIAGGNLPRISPSRIGGKLTWRSGNWYADGGATHVFKQDRIATFETSTSGYTSIDASVRYRWAYAANRSADFYMLGKTLINRDIQVHTSFLKDFAPLPGRSAFVGVTATY
jgi:iron complex outermembrane receptor protein